MKKLNRKFYLWLQKMLGRATETYAPHGVDVHVPASSDLAIRYLLAKGRPYEEPEADMVRRFLTKDTNVIELGGCFGIISALIRNQIGRDAHHIIAELNPDLADICRQNAGRNAASDVSEVVEAAVDYSGQKTVNFARGHNAHVGRVANKDEAGITVPTTTLSKIADKLPDGPFALVCDIEGAEIALFEAEAALMPRISSIILETHPGFYPNGDNDLEKLLTQIKSYGFQQLENRENVVYFARKDA